MGRGDMRGQEIRSRCKDSERFNRSDIAVLEVDEPVRDVGIGDTGDYFL